MSLKCHRIDVRICSIGHAVDVFSLRLDVRTSVRPGRGPPARTSHHEFSGDGRKLLEAPLSSCPEKSFTGSNNSGNDF